MSKRAKASLPTPFVICVFALAVGLTVGELVNPHPSLAAMDSTMVTLPGDRVEQSSPAAADFDGDGDKEIVIGGRDGIVHVVARTGSSWSVVWSRQTADDLNAAGAPSGGCVTSQSDIRSSPAIGDLDSDGKLEIVVTTGGDVANHRNGGVLVYRYEGPWSFSPVHGWPQPKLDIVGADAGASNPDGCWDGIWSSPALGDVDGDGDLEIAVEGFDRALHLWHHDGRYVEGWPVTRPDIVRGGWSSPAMADLDEDGLLEIVFGTDNFNGSPPPYLLYVFNGDASLLPGFPVEAAQNIKSSPAIGDIDGDGALDIVVGTGGYEDSGGNRVYAWDGDGYPLRGWPKVTGGDMPASPALGDLDGDGDLEVVIGCGKEGDPYPSPCSELYAWHGDGNVVDGFPINVGPNNPWEPQGPDNGLPYSPMLADYDGDGGVEILAQSRWSWGVSTVERVNGAWRENNNPALRTNAPLSAPALVDDVDDDGAVEIVVGGAADSEGAAGALYIWDMSGEAQDALPWPMFQHDIFRSGQYGRAPGAPVLAFPDEITILHETGSSETVVKDVLVRNEGEGYIEWQISEAIDRLNATPRTGTVVDEMPIQFEIDTGGLRAAWHTLGEVTVTGQFEGAAVQGNPAVATVRLYLGDLYRANLPMVARGQ